MKMVSQGTRLRLNLKEKRENNDVVELRSSERGPRNR
jgi:hypothetical protein